MRQDAKEWGLTALFLVVCSCVGTILAAAAFVLIALLAGWLL